MRLDGWFVSMNNEHLMLEDSRTSNYMQEMKSSTLIDLSDLATSTKLRYFYIGYGNDWNSSRTNAGIPLILDVSAFMLKTPDCVANTNYTTNIDIPRRGIKKWQ